MFIKKHRADKAAAPNVSKASYVVFTSFRQALGLVIGTFIKIHPTNASTEVHLPKTWSITT